MIKNKLIIVLSLLMMTACNNEEQEQINKQISNEADCVLELRYLIENIEEENEQQEALFVPDKLLRNNPKVNCYNTNSYYLEKLKEKGYIITYHPENENNNQDIGHHKISWQVNN